MKTVIPATTLAAFMICFAFIQSATAITLNTNSTWPVTPKVEVVPPASQDTRWQTTTGRDPAQSFKAPTPFKVDSIYLLYEMNGGGAPDPDVNSTFRLRIYEVDDVNAPAFSGTQIFLSTETFNTSTYDGATGVSGPYKVVEFAFQPADVLTLSPRTGTKGYAFQIDMLVDSGFEWRARTGSPFYADGTTYISGASDAYDFTLAITGQELSAVPEPSTYALAALGLAGLGFAALRKKSKKHCPHSVLFADNFDG